MRSLLSFIFCVSILSSGIAQAPISVSNQITTSLVFPCAIKHIDRGTQGIIVQLVEAIPNILLVKAAGENIEETNLSIITDDGEVYSFLIQFVEKPEVAIYNLTAPTKTSVASYAKGIIDNTRNLRGVSDRKWDIMSTVSGIYVKNNMLYFHIQINNQSPLDYDVELLRFFIKDRKKAKRTAVQEIELTPEFIAGNIKKVKAYSRNAVVFVIPKVTIPDAKFLGIQLMEKSGGRHLFMKVRNKKLLQARILPDYN